MRETRTVLPTGKSQVLLALLIAAIPYSGRAEDLLPPVNSLKRLSLEELMDIEVTSVSKHPQKLAEAASAVQVITQEDIRRSGATSLPEALELASNLQVAQKTGREWAISARGFNNTAANKLLVMIDGRTVYTPLYSGVFWDAQNVFLEDVDRIEVISGPGGTLWGSNAVNGVINIITKEAAATQGSYLSLGAGSLLRSLDQARYGGKIGENAFYRVYGERLEHNSLAMANGKSARNPWDLSQGGFRVDWQRSESDRLTLQGDAYGGDFQEQSTADVGINGQNVLGRWTHAYSERSDLQVQAYFDRTRRETDFAPGIKFTDDLNSYDLDIQYHFPLGQRNNVLLGSGYRLMQDEVGNFILLGFLPARKDMNRINAFAQDEISLLSRRLKITLGTKVEREDYSGFNLQPAARAALSPNDQHTIWAAVSRAVRTPSRIDVELFAPLPPVPPTVLKIGGGKDFHSENLLAYELGYRLQPFESISLSLAAFYNRYHDLRSTELGDATTAVFRNGLEGDSRGVEFSGNIQPVPWFRLRGGYTYLESDIWEKAGHTDYTHPHGEWDDPAHQVSVQYFFDLPEGFQLDFSTSYVGELPDPKVQGRFSYSAGVSWKYRNLEASLFGRNLADDQDPEFGPALGRQEIPRSVYGTLALRI